MDKPKKGLITLLLVALLGGGGYAGVTQFGNAASTRHATVSTHTTIVCGPQEEVRALATSSGRTYALFANQGEGGDTIFLSLNADIASAEESGIFLTASSSYEIREDMGNLYTGSVRCTSQASSTLTVIQVAD